MTDQVYPPPKVPLLKQINGLDLGAVVQNTWYTALQGTNITVDGFAYKITVADETVECRLTIDGVTFTASSIALAFGGNAFSAISGIRVSNMTVQANAASASVDMNQASNPLTAAWLRGKSIKIELRKTTAAGASHILVYSIYHQA